jgi:CBS domain-containing protein
MKIKDILKHKVVATTKDTYIKDAASLMYTNNVGAVVVTEKREGNKQVPVGILTDRDIALSISKNSNFDSHKKIETIMSKNVILCRPEDGVSNVIQKMRDNGIRRMPVVDNHDYLLGVISSDDLLLTIGEEIGELSEIITTEMNKEKKTKFSLNKERQLSAQTQTFY